MKMLNSQIDKMRKERKNKNDDLINYLCWLNQTFDDSRDVFYGYERLEILNKVDHVYREPEADEDKTLLNKKIPDDDKDKQIKKHYIEFYK